MVEIAADIPCLVRKEGLLAISSLGFLDYSVQQSVGLSPTGLERGLQEPRDYALPAHKNWASLGLPTGTQ